ncbi:hypothetical protein EC968_006475 [Mortierella alpina]|nr:hypothetical protein EC968_006475 [Mortierella alpina]
MARTDVANMVAVFSRHKSSLEKEVKALKRVLTARRINRTLVRRELNLHKGDTAKYRALVDARKEVRAALSALSPKLKQLRYAQQQWYYWNKLDKTRSMGTESSTSTSTSTSTTKKQMIPTWDHYTVEDDLEHTDLSNLTADTEHRTVYSGTDYGLCKMSETIALTQSQLDAHMYYYHKSVSAQVPAQVAPARVPRVPPSYTITAEMLNEVSYLRRMGKRRENRLRLADDSVKDAFQILSEKTSSLTTATTIAEINLAHDTRKGVREAVRVFEMSKFRQKDRHTARLRKALRFLW